LGFFVKNGRLWGRFVCGGCSRIEARMVSPDGANMVNGRGEDLGPWDTLLRSELSRMEEEMQATFEATIHAMEWDPDRS
jgi:hypothetical protein